MPETEEIVRLSLPFNRKTRKIEFSKMRGSTRDALKSALADPDARAALGHGAGDAGAPSTTADHDALAGLVTTLLYDSISSIAVLIARFRGFAPEHADLLRYTTEEKAMFAPLTMRVLAKYDLMNNDEAVLIGAVGAVTASHLVAMTQAANAARSMPRVPTVDDDAVSERVS
jgi:hypothetical protein